jgi:hypothetical protein
MTDASVERAFGNFPDFTGSVRIGRSSATAVRLGGAFAIAGALIGLLTISPWSNRQSIPAPDNHAVSPTSAVPSAKRADSLRIGVPLEVAKVFDEEEDLLRRANTPVPHSAPILGWSPTGGLDTLLANRFVSPTPDQPATASTSDTRTASTDVPLPSRKPAARSERPASQVATTAPAADDDKAAANESTSAAAGQFNFFAKLFGFMDHAPTTLLASNPQTAVYDIKHHVVYLPNGEKLEAHSGLGEWLDDPGSMDRKSKGVTPPNVYALSLRTPLFHGVQAIRLTPVGDASMFGRDGMLAHPYMLGANGQSNGCVSFKDYPRFLQAFRDGEVKRLIVVPDSRSQPARVAKAE